jgi:hypothetical protein
MVISGRSGLGAPLTVQRRCDDPMLEIANPIADDGLMIDATDAANAERFGDEHPDAPDTQWIDVRAAASEGPSPADRARPRSTRRPPPTPTPTSASHQPRSTSARGAPTLRRSWQTENSRNPTMKPRPAEHADRDTNHHPRAAADP